MEQISAKDEIKVKESAVWTSAAGLESGRRRNGVQITGRGFSNLFEADGCARVATKRPDEPEAEAAWTAKAGEVSVTVGVTA